MEALIVLLCLFLFFSVFVFPFWAMAKISKLRDGITRLESELQYESQKFKRELAELKSTLKATASSRAHVVESEPEPRREPAVEPVADVSAAPPPPAPMASPEEAWSPSEQPAAAAPLESQTEPQAWTPEPEPVLPTPAPAPELPKPSFAAQPPPLTRYVVEEKSAINWEQFMGVKLFAWLAGFAAFLGVAFGIKYSFEHELIPREVRAGLGFLFSFGLVVAGLKMMKGKYRVTAQTLCATGIVSLYAVTFACHAIYQFPAFSSATAFGVFLTFGLMSLITVTAFLLAVRLEAQVVAVLGIVGGFLTPVLINTGHDNPLGLFSYVALLNAGLAAVVLSRRWGYLLLLGVGGTVLLQVGWAARYATELNGVTALTQALCLQAEFGLIFFFTQRRNQNFLEASASFWTATLSALAFIVHTLLNTHLAQAPAVAFAALFLCDALGLSLCWLEERLAKIPLLLGGAVFAVLSLWTGSELTNDTLGWGLAAFFLFALVHASAPLVFQRRHPSVDQGTLAQWFPALGLVLVLQPLLHDSLFSALLWPAVLAVDLVAIVLAALTGMILGVAAVLVLTLLIAAHGFSGVSVGALSLGTLMLVIGAFSVLFLGASLWLRHRGVVPADGEEGKGFRLTTDHLPVLSSLLPFLLVVVAVNKLPLADPTIIFGFLFVLNVLALGVARLLVAPWVPLCALGGTTLAVTAWTFRNPASDTLVPILWILGYHGLFAAFPLVFRSVFETLRGPWLAAGLSGLALFTTLYRLATRGHGPLEGAEGAIPGLLALVPLASLMLELRQEVRDPPSRLFRLALFGGATLAFVTLVFPVQFSRQYLTLGWALEGAALCWLYGRVAHRGLPITGVVLLAAVFARLLFNPAVLSYHPSGDQPIWNWYLASYGLAALSMFAAVAFLAPPRERVFGTDIRPWLTGAAVVLLFALLNIEIADFFAPPHSATLTFEFSGNFARDMSYTIGWAIFALLLLVGGVWKDNRWARYVALGLLSVSLLKLFFHDLASLGALYRIGALFAVAVIAMLASMVYQRFLSPRPNEKVS